MRSTEFTWGCLHRNKAPHHPCPLRRGVARCADDWTSDVGPWDFTVFLLTGWKTLGWWVGHADVASRRSIDYCRLLMIIVQFGLVCFKEEACFSKLVSQHVLKMLPPAWKLWNPLRCRRHVYNYAVVPQGIVRPFEWAKPPHVFFYLCCAFWSQGILMCFKMLQPTQFQDVKRMRKLLDVAFQNLNRWGWVPGEVRQWRLKMTTTQVKKW